MKASKMPRSISAHIIVGPFSAAYYRPIRALSSAV